MTKTPWAHWVGLVGMIALLTAPLLAHGGQYTNPNTGQGTPRKGPDGGPRGGGTTAGAEPTWRNWWDRNREDFFNVRERRKLKVDRKPEQDAQGYDVEALHQPATSADIQDIIIPLLIETVKDPTSDVRDAAAIALGRAGSVPVLEHLVPLLDDSSRNVREAAIMGIGLLRHPKSEQALIDKLVDPDLGAKERGMVALALGLSGGKRATDTLSEKLGTASPFGRISRVKYRQVEGCRALGLALSGDPTAFKFITEAISKDRTKDNNFVPMALAALTKVPDPAAAPIAASRLDDRKHQTRRSAAILAGYVIPASDQKAMRQFIRTVADESDQHAQNFGIISIGRLGGDDAVKWLVHALEKERHRETRAFAALALGIAKNTDSAPALREAVATEKDETLRGAAAVALGILGDRDSAETILKVLKEERNPELRADLVTALGMLEFEGATEFVRELLGEARNRRLVQACGLFLAVVNDSSSIDLMLRVMRHSGSIQVKGGMATAIGRMADRRSIEELVKLVKDGSETDQTRAFALVALGLIADQADVSAFARISIDSNYALDDAQALLEAIDIF